jgi:hypothetical protein
MQQSFKNNGRTPAPPTTNSKEKIYIYTTVTTAPAKL